MAIALWFGHAALEDSKGAPGRRRVDVLKRGAAGAPIVHARSGSVQAVYPQPVGVPPCFMFAGPGLLRRQGGLDGFERRPQYSSKVLQLKIPRRQDAAAVTVPSPIKVEEDPMRNQQHRGEDQERYAEPKDCVARQYGLVGTVLDGRDQDPEEVRKEYDDKHNGAEKVHYIVADKLMFFIVVVWHLGTLGGCCLVRIGT